MGSFFLILFIISAIIFLFWQKILDFLLFFLPEKVDVSGKLVGAFIKPGFYPFFASVDSSFLAFDISRGIPVDFYYINIWEPQKDEHKVVAVDFFIYEDMKKRLDNLDLNVSISCRKNPFTGELYV